MYWLLFFWIQSQDARTCTITSYPVDEDQPVKILKTQFKEFCAKQTTLTQCMDGLTEKNENYFTANETQAIAVGHDILKKMIDVVCEDDGLKIIKLRDTKVGICVERQSRNTAKCMQELGDRIRDRYGEENFNPKCSDYVELFMGIRDCAKDNIMKCSNEVATILESMVNIVAEEVRETDSDTTKCDAFYKVMLQS